MIDQHLPAGFDDRPLRSGLLTARRRRRSIHQPAQALAIAACGVAALVAALVSLTDGFDDGPVLSALGIAALAVAVGLWRTSVFPNVPRTASVMAMVTAIWCTQVAFSTLVYLATGAVDDWVDAVFESMSGFSTAGFTTLVPESLGRGEHTWRALTQWLGGFGALIVVVAVLPFVGRGPQGDDLRTRRGPSFAPSTLVGLRRIAAVYATGTAAVFAAYAVAGMAWFDALAHSLTTVSTGGFSTRTDALAAFDSAAIEWVAIAAMLLAGVSVALLWAAARGAIDNVVRSTELRVYLAFVVVVSAVFVAWDTASADATSIRHAAFTATSLVSTTGYRITDFSGWHPGTDTIVVMTMFVGAMAGSAGGGFRIQRVVTLAAFGRRELSRQLHRTMVRHVRLDGRALGDRTLSRMVGYSFLYTAVVVVGVALVAETTDLAVTPAAHLAVAATSTTGGLDVGHLSEPARLVLVGVMLLGRLSITPVLDAVASVAVLLRRALPRRRERRR